MASYTKGLIDFPLTFRKLICTKMTQNFREAITLNTSTISKESLKPTDVLIRSKYVGINASDINVTAGMFLLSPLKGFEFTVYHYRALWISQATLYCWNGGPG